MKRKLKRALKQWRRNKTAVLVTVLGVLFVCVFVFVYTTYMQNRRLSVDPRTYAPLLQLIAEVESKGNYNAYFGNARNKEIDFTNMTIAEVRKWQYEQIKKGAASSAVGRYQIIDTTLEGLIQQLGIDSTERFDEQLQDKLAIALLERRGADEYVNKELTQDEFAANLAKEWAALPKVIGENPQDSYYASDGLNRSLVEVDTVRKAIEPIRPL